MAKSVRQGVFETNSSSTHAFSIICGDYTSITGYAEEEIEDVYLSNSDIDNLLDNLPKSKLLEALRRRNNEDNKK